MENAPAALADCIGEVLGDVGVVLAVPHDLFADIGLAVTEAVLPSIFQCHRGSPLSPNDRAQRFSLPIVGYYG